MELVGLMLLLLLSFPAVGRMDYYDCKVDIRLVLEWREKKQQQHWGLVTKRTDRRTEEKRGEVGDMKQYHEANTKCLWSKS